jgi:benzodiazapine receptor
MDYHLHMDFKLVTASIGILLVFIYAFGSGIWVSYSPGWYASLTRTENISWLVFFALSIFAALTWAYQFYVPHNFTLATIALVLAALLTLPVLYLTFKASLVMGLLLVPYQIWVAIAASVAWGYLTRN